MRLVLVGRPVCFPGKHGKLRGWNKKLFIQVSEAWGSGTHAEVRSLMIVDGFQRIAVAAVATGGMCQYPALAFVTPIRPTALKE